MLSVVYHTFSWLLQGTQSIIMNVQTLMFLRKMALYLRSQTDVKSFLHALMFRKGAVMFLPSPAVYSKQTNKQKLGDAVFLFESNHHSTIYLRHLIIMSTEIRTLEAGTAEWKELVNWE